MAEAFNLYVGDGVTVLYPFTFEYLETDDIYVSVDSQPNTNWVLSSATEITFNSAPANGADIIIFRRTDIDSMEAVFAAASAIRAKDLNLDFTQLRLAIEENRDLLSEAQINELMDLFWNKGSETLYLANTWEASDLKIASTAAINAYVTNSIDNANPGVSSLTAGGNISLDPLNGLGDVTITSDPGVSRIVAGENIVLNPSNGVGIVTITSTGGSGGVVYKGTRDLTQPAPNSPEDGDFYINTATSGTVDNTWTGIGGEALTGYERVFYDGSSWDLLPEQGAGGASVEVSDTPPSSPSEGDLWWDSSPDSGQLYIYYVDDNSSQWVQASSASGGGGQDLQSVTDAGNITTNGATFAGNVITTGYLETIRSTTNNAFILASFANNTNASGNGKYIFTGESLQIGPEVNPNAGGSGFNTEINVDGSATFAGTVTSSGSYSFIGRNSSNAAVFAASDTGLVNIGVVNGADSNIVLNGANGSATFNGTVKTDLWFQSDRTDGSGSVLYGLLNGAEAVNITANGDAKFKGSVWAGTNNAFTAGNVQLNADGSGSFSGTLTATVVPPSDARFKENITPAKPQLADVVALGGILKNYDWTDEAPLNEELRAVRQLGLIAQEVAEVCPSLVKDINAIKTMEIAPAVVGPKGRVIKEAVTEQVDDSYKGLSQEALIMKLIGAVSEQNALIQALQSQVQTLLTGDNS